MTLLKAYLQQASCLAIKKKLQGMPKGKKTKNKKQKKNPPSEVTEQATEQKLYIILHYHTANLKQA